MAEFDLSLLGDKKLDRKLAKLPKALQKKAVNKGLRAGAKILLKEAKSLVPVQPGSGRLKKSLRVKALKRSRQFTGFQVQTGEREKLGIPAGSRWYYPAHVELGTSKKSAQSYLRKGLLGKKTVMMAAIAGALKQFIQSQRK